MAVTSGQGHPAHPGVPLAAPAGAFPAACAGGLWWSFVWQLGATVLLAVWHLILWNRAQVIVQELGDALTLEISVKTAGNCLVSNKYFKCHGLESFIF